MARVGIDDPNMHLHQNEECVHRFTLINERGATHLTPNLLRALRLSLDGLRGAQPLVIEGTASDFCHGLDLEWAETLGESSTQASDVMLIQIMEVFQSILNTLRRWPKPVISVVTGHASGAGLGFLGVSDVVIAHEQARFSAPETMLGLIPAKIYPYLVRRMGVARAKLFGMGGVSLTAAKASAWGLVDEVVDDLNHTLQGYLKRWARVDSRTVNAMKALTEDHWPIPEGFNADADQRFVELIKSPSTQQRMKNFREGVAPWE
ncbi:enoyl-CoA hydratase/isomerase family protein [Candidatus Nitronereus thalassa]|uniref:Enoyl-CoA hydratase/isomerase family protein n=1 Tax=Candidatus Nitronereus thalassa TaxID=3020898 RepID=A0ABU3K4B4_9BACT|nr:enoyl-CoA hydratase/isomerase family protein [Candidatus Nitronereus thalassa]MDT7041218.1 enoyl-CoA hydratase/isomerase family protein [Candidatus Nitronereus thalassa]